jgi:hypothetical protein
MRPRLAAAKGALLLCVLLAVAPASAAPPAVPGALTYQGVLLDAQGDPRTGSVDLTLRLFDAATGGTLLYSQTLTGVPLDAGVFTVVLGPTGAASDVPDDPLTTSLAQALVGDLAATGPNRFLEVTVGSEGPLTRIQLLATPYALRATSAQTADTATSAEVANEVTSVGGVSNSFVTQLFQYGNSDGGGPLNSSPEEGLGDTDGDGVANFVDSDNDDDGLSDAAETSQGSDINLVTPQIASFTPSTLAEGLAGSPVTIHGAGFQAGITVEFGSQSLVPTDVTTTSLDVLVGPQAAGTVGVQAENVNGEVSNVRSFTFSAQSNTLSRNLADHITLDVKGDVQMAVGGAQDYGVDTDGNGLIDVEIPLPGPTGIGVPRSQSTVAWDPLDQLAGLRCFQPGSDPDVCDVQFLRDTDADLILDAVTVIETLSGATNPASGRRAWASTPRADPSPATRRAARSRSPTTSPATATSPTRTSSSSWNLLPTRRSRTRASSPSTPRAGSPTRTRSGSGAPGRCAWPTTSRATATSRTPASPPRRPPRWDPSIAQASPSMRRAGRPSSTAGGATR